MDTERLAESTQEQALGAWVDYLVKLRLSALAETLQTLDLRLEDTLALLDQCKRDVYECVIDRGLGRGGPHGMKGFIAERVDVAIENARSIMDGSDPIYTLLDNNGPADFLRDGTEIQQKFTMAHFSVDAIVDHLDTYPSFAKNGGVYRIPKDNYDELNAIRAKAIADPSSLRLGQRTTWERLQELDRRGVSLDSNIEPASISFKQSFKENFETAIDSEKAAATERNDAEKAAARVANGPSVAEAGKVIASGAVLEGSTALALCMYEKLKSGKQLSEFTQEDWKEIGIETSVGTVKGGIRGGVVYAAVNYTAITGATATAAVTATYGMIAQANQLRMGRISRDEFLINSEAICTEVAVSAVSSIVGQAIIPVPIIGALIGNSIGTLMYGIASRYLDDVEVAFIREFQNECSLAARRLDEGMQSQLRDYELSIESFDSLIHITLSEDRLAACEATNELALLAGVDRSRLAMTPEEGDLLFG